jgi:hypothetical protein
MSEEVESRATIQIDRFPIHASGALQINSPVCMDCIVFIKKERENIRI